MDKTHKPNIRSMFKPDAGYTIIEVDLKQSDAQVVAWEARAINLQNIFIAAATDPSIDVHIENARIAYGILAPAKITEAQRQISKRLVHGTDFGGSSRELARRVGILVHQVDVFQRRWFAANPEIKTWHNEVSYELQTTRSVTNIYGYRRIFFDRVEVLLPEALAWKPQSTTALTINEGIRRVTRRIPAFQFLMQVHDSALLQIAHDLLTLPRLLALRDCFLVELPYKPRPLTIGVDLKTSQTSWGDVEKMKWPERKQLLAAAQVA